MENKNTNHKSEKRIFSIIKRIQSFENAFYGLKVFLQTTHNAWIQIVAGILVVWLGFVFNISQTEWLFVVMSIGAVLTAEAFNTALEFDIDLTSPQYHEYAKYTKDVAAGAVLITSTMAVIVGLMIFLPKIFLFS
ncbi:MAG: diacylglycerol kinase [Patescibacteria group bacterium]|jgi:diacylglycerol kinase|nr:diacylglycerol kinase [Patescibacteria group bacterium]